MLTDKINVAEWFHAKSPSSTRCKEGDLPLLNFFNLTCMKSAWIKNQRVPWLPFEFSKWKVEDMMCQLRLLQCAFYVTCSFLSNFIIAVSVLFQQNAAVARLVAYNIIEPITVRGTKYANMMQFLLASPIFIFTAWEVYYRVSQNANVLQTLIKYHSIQTACTTN